MKKNIVILTGSARKKGNSDLLADAFIAGAKEAGHEVSKFKTAEKCIEPCRACDKCFSKGKACIFDDDFNELAELLEKADALVLAMPLYWYSFPAAIKLAMDKFHAFGVGKKNLPIKEAALMVCAEDDAPNAFDGVVASYNLILNYKEWKDCGQILVPEVHKKGEIKGNASLEKARKLGLGI